MKMSFKENIRKILVVILWCVTGSGMLVLLIAAINRKNSKTCKGYRVEINGGNQRLFIDQKVISSLLTSNGTQKLLGKTILSFDLRNMEEMLKKNPWVKEAQLFFDNNESLRVRITERKPVARIFNVSGNSFYIDSSGVQMPVPDQSFIKLPVFTGFPADKLKSRGADSALLHQIKQLSWFILNNPFWMAEIQQVAITSRKTFQMIPVIGNHQIEFGDGNEYEQKFHRLFVFYRQVSTRTGFDKYSRLDVQYAGQVIGTKRGSGMSRFDSLQAIKNIRQLIRSSQQTQADTGRQQITKPLERNTITEQTLTSYDMVDEKNDSAKRELKIRNKK
jgi:cell division protein FtsQ